MVRDLRSLPKAHLHLHLEGAMRPDTLTELCARHGLTRPTDTRGLRFESFGPFAATYIAACQCLREEADLKRLLTEVAEDAANDGAVWVEVAPSIELYAPLFGGLAATLKLLLRLSKEVEEEQGIGIGFIISAARHESPADAEALALAVRTEADALLPTRPHALVGFGLHADEEGNPPEPFARAFEIACGGDSPVKAMPHAGEIAPGDLASGPRSVAFCVDVLGAARVGHGVLAAPDAPLVARMATSGVCLDVCPTSNFLLSVVPSLEAHPLPRLLAQGVTCTINADDPLLFGCSLLSEFEVCRHTLGMDDETLGACARASFQHARCSDAVRNAGIAGVDAWLALDA